MNSCNYLPRVLFLMAFAFSVFACKKDSTDQPVVPPPPVVVKPVIDSLKLSADSRLLTVFFSQGVFGHNRNGEIPVSKAHLDFKLSGGQALLDSVKVMHTAGDSVATVALYVSGVINGSELLEVRALNDSSVKNKQSHYMVPEVKSVTLNETGIFGLWVSTGTNLSPLFQQFNFDSIVMEYMPDGTYTYESIKTGSIHNRLSGTYSQSKSSVTGIWVITLNQQTPVASVMEGIFAPEHGNPVMLKYETVQTMPAVQGLTPPHPLMGFGSSGIFGEENIQTFIKVAVY